MARTSTSKFTSMPSNERRSAQALLNSWNRQISRWQAQADFFTSKWINYPDRASVSISEYLSYTPIELSAYATVDQFRASLDSRKYALSVRVEAERSDAQRNKNFVPPDGYLVYLCTCYNHGLGANFVGYAPEEDGEFEPTDITEW